MKNKISIINILEKSHSKNRIFTESIKIRDYKVTLKINGTFENMINILNFYQNHFSILYYKLDNIKNKLHCELELDTKYMFNENENENTNTNKISNLSNPFIVKKARKAKKIVKKIVKRKPLNISAIVSSEVLINNAWYIKGDVVNNNKIMKINIDSVELLDISENKRYILRVHNE